MAMGKRRDKQGELFVAAADLPEAPGNPFYQRLNAILADADFDAFIEAKCLPFYVADQGRPSIAPGVYFRMLFVGYFEGIGSQRGIAWRCADSRSLQAFLGFLPTEATPDHSSLTRVRQRLSEALHAEVFSFVLKLAADRGLCVGKSVGVDATQLEANAAMKTLVRTDGGDDYQEYLRKLAVEAGIENPSKEELLRFDRSRKGKTMSNDDWESPTDAEAKIAKMKDGTTHLAYKAEHVVDLGTDLIVAAEIHPANASDGNTAAPSMSAAEEHLQRAGIASPIEEVAADKGYHRLDLIDDFAEAGYRTYIPEPGHPHEHVWDEKPESQECAYRNNRKRMKRAYGKQLGRWRSERVERTFAHLCETGGGRRSHLRGRTNVQKRWWMQAAAHNLGLVMRKLFGIGTPRGLQGAGSGKERIVFALERLPSVLKRLFSDTWAAAREFAIANRNAFWSHATIRKPS
jgi:transposase